MIRYLLLAFTLLLIDPVGLAASTPAVHGGAYRPIPAPRRPAPPTGRGLPTTGHTPTRARTPSTAPSAPAAPAVTPVGPVGAGGGAGSASTAGGGNLPPDTLTWEVWWDYNRERFLQIKSSGAVPVAITPAGSTKEAEALDAGFLQRRWAAENVVPALEGILDSRKPSIDMRSSAVLALGRAGAHPRYASRLLAQLSDPNQEVAETAALALGTLGSPHVIGDLEALLHDLPAGRKLVQENEVPLRTREYAAYGLAILGESTNLGMIRAQVADTLLRAIEQGSRQPQSFSAACLVALAQVPLQDEEPTMRRLGVLMRNTQRPIFVRANLPNTIARLLSSSDSAESTGAWSAEFAARLLDRSEPALLRLSCAQALGWLAVPSEDADAVFRSLATAIDNDNDPRIRHQALLSLGMLASRGLPSSQTIAMPMLLKKLSEGSFYERGWSALSLGVMCFEARANQRDVPGLIVSRLRMQLPQEGNPSVRSAIAIAQGLANDTRGEESLLELLGDSRNPEVQAHVAVALGLLDSDSALPVLRKLLRESKRRPDLLTATAEALTLLEDDTLNDQLLDLLGDSGDATFATTAAISLAMGSTRDINSTDRLIEIIDNPRSTKLAKAFAASALGLIADVEPLPFRARFARCLNYYAAPETAVGSDGVSGLLNLL